MPKFASDVKLLSNRDPAVGEALGDMIDELTRLCEAVTIVRRLRHTEILFKYKHYRRKIVNRDLASALFAALGEIEMLEGE